jgi:hypothetical protein
MAVLLGGVRKFFREYKNKGPRQPPEANADRESPVHERIIAQDPTNNDITRWQGYMLD